MNNWSVDVGYLKKFPAKYRLWKLEQMLSWGLGGEKISKKEVIKNWDYLKNRLDTGRRELLEYLLWRKLS